MALIFHITTQSHWQAAQAAGSFTEPSLAKEGFIHCSLASQVIAVANCKYKGKRDLVLLEIDDTKVSSRVTFEDLYNLKELYPHIYGPLNLDAVIRVHPFLQEADGSFRLPVGN
jgi:uncharacterized protein (DUF952 family)